MTEPPPNLPALDKEVELTYSDILAGARAAAKLTGGYSTFLKVLLVVAFLNIALAAFGPPPVEIGNLVGWSLALVFFWFLLPLSAWVQHRRLGPDGRRMRVVLGDGYLDYHLGGSLLRVAFSDVSLCLWAPRSLVMRTKNRMVIHLPRRLLDNSAEGFVRTQLAYSKDVSSGGTRRRLLKIAAIWLVLVIAFAAIWDLLKTASP